VKTPVNERLRQAVVRSEAGDTDAIRAELLDARLALVIEWLTPSLDHFIRRALKPVPEAHPYLPFMEGYVSLDRRLSLGEKRTIELKKATVYTLRKRLAVVREKADEGKEATTLRRLIEGMEGLAYEHPRLTVERYCELRAAGIEAPATKYAAAPANP
jgi:hypothetical protein